jgi:outer membrane lipoprotein-sorting protein
MIKFHLRLTFSVVAIGALAFLLMPSSRATARADTLPPAPSAILAEADKARGNLAGAEWVLHLRTYGGKSDESMTLDVKARGFDVVTLTLEPARSKGNRFLILKKNVWFDKPGLSKPVPISRRQKLLGEAAYGDIATTNYAGDYSPTLLGTDTIGGKVCWVFDLKAKSNDVTYDRIKYWVDQQTFTGIQAEYFTLSGKKFKSARMEYDNRVRRDGSLKPFISKITILDEVVKSQHTTLTFSDPQLQALPDYIFRVSRTP